MSGRVVLFFSALVVALAFFAQGNENGLARTPPMGWLSWNLYGANVDQDLIEKIMDGMVSKKRSVDGVPTSLCDLGYCDVGLDDNWQKCGHYGPDGLTYHDEDGNPVINKDRFPNMKDMTDHAHKLGLTAGWYGNNCICSDHKIGDRKFYQGDVKALRAFGYDSWKLDGCGAQTDMQLWDDVNNDTVQDAVWPLISNKEVIAVNQAYFGFSGGTFEASGSTAVDVQLDNINWAAVTRNMTVEEQQATGPTIVPDAQYLYKPMNWEGTEAAVLLMNHGNDTDLTLKFSDVPGLKCSSCKLRDVWEKKDLGTFTGSYTAKAVGSHDAAFLMITPA